MRRAVSFQAAVAALGVWLAVSVPGPVRAGAVAESNDEADLYFRIEAYIRVNETDLRLSKTEAGALDAATSNDGGNAAERAAAAIARSGTFKLVNYGATLQPGESTQGGRMKKTIWGGLRQASAGRVVVHTYGTAIDTALAVYAGDALADLKPVAFNDNKPAPGVGVKQSLVQFDAKAATDYRVQIGSPTADEDDVYATVNAFPPAGGLSAFLATYNGAPFQNRTFVCVAPSSCTPSATNPRFVLHNSMDTTLIVTAASDLGRGVVAPKPVVLTPGQVKTVTFTFTNAFDATTVRTVAGAFTFTGRAAGKVASLAQHPALIVVKGVPEGPDALRVAVDAQVRAGRVGSSQVFKIDVTNGGSVTARGCHARSQIYENLNVAWQRVNAGAVFGEVNAPFSIAAGRTATMIVAVQARAAYLAEPRFNGFVDIDCANTQAAKPNDVGAHFEITARGALTPADMLARTVSPVGGVLNAFAGRATAFRVLALNTGPTARLTARPDYVAPSGDGPAEQFAATVCETDADGACLRPATAAVPFLATRGVLKYFKVLVRGPAGAPAFDPAQRRMFLNFEQDKGSGLFGVMLVGAESVAVRRR